MSKIKSTLLLILPTIIFLSINNMTYFAQAKSQFDTNENGVNEIVWSLNDIIFYQDCPVDDGSSNDVSVCNANLPEETIKKLESLKIKEKAEENMERYEYAASKTGLIWQIVAALHYREGGMSSDQSILNGEKLYDHINSDGKKVVSDPNEDAKNAAEHLISMGKSIYGVDITTDQSIEALGKAFLAYNRGNMYTDKCGNGNIPYTDSPYVMNYYDDNHIGMSWIHADSYCNGKKINSVEGSVNEQLGALVIVAYLCGDGNNTNGNLDDSAGDGGSEGTNDDSGGLTNSISASSSSSNAKKIAETAIKLAWSHEDKTKAKGKSEEHAKSEFIEATKALGTWEDNKDHGPDCGYFVKAVIATVDPNIVYQPNKETMDPFRNKLKEGKYSNDWEVIDFKDGDTSKLQAGDIVWGYTDNNHQHYWIPVEIDGKLWKAEASHRNEIWGRISDKVPKKWDKYETQYIFRPKGGEPACNSCEQGSLNINGAGACLAWPIEATSKDWDQDDGGHPTELAWKAWKATGLYDSYKNDPDRWEGDFCSGFTTNVVRWSGYDKNFTTNLSIGGYEQVGYANSHPDLWETKQWTGEKSELQGGDILVSSDHSWMVIQDETGELYMAEASLHGNTFGHVVKYRGKGSGTVYIIRATHARNSNAGVSVHGDMETSSITGTIIDSSQNKHDIGAAARYFAYPTHDDKAKNEPKEKEAWKTLLKNNGITNFGATNMGKDCGAFVGGVLRYAGATDRLRGINSHTNTVLIPDLKESDGWIKVDTDGDHEADLQDGDVIFEYDGNGKERHFAIFLRGEDGKAQIAEASHGRNYGWIGKFYTSGRKRVVYRYKDNKSGGSDSNECNMCTGEEGEGAGGGKLVSGGFKTVEEARKAVMYEYQSLFGNEAAAVKKYHLDGALPCAGGYVDNCVVFSRWFINRFTNKKMWAGEATGYGKDVAGKVAKFYGLKTDITPSVYSVFSGPGSGWEGHTGIVLGIDKERGKIIIGEAGCNQGKDFADAKEKPLSNYTNGKYTFVNLNSILGDI